MNWILKTLSFCLLSVSVYANTEESIQLIQQNCQEDRLLVNPSIEITDQGPVVRYVSLTGETSPIVLVTNQAGEVYLPFVDYSFSQISQRYFASIHLNEAEISSIKINDCTVFLEEVE
jgi:hypothetical protein